MKTARKAPMLRPRYWRFEAWKREKEGWPRWVMMTGANSITYTQRATLGVGAPSWWR